MYRWVVFLHILSAFAFFMVHGASAVMAFRLRQEHEPERIRAILDLSNAALPVMYASLVLLFLAGIIAGIMGGWFSQGWIWTALVMMVLLWGSMQVYASRYYAPVRKAVGMPYRIGKTDYPAESPASPAEVAKRIQATRPVLLAAISFGLVAIVLWLMMFKPF